MSAPSFETLDDRIRRIAREEVRKWSMTARLHRAQPIGLFAIPLHGENGRVERPRLGIDLSAIIAAPLGECVWVDEDALDEEALLVERAELPLHPRPPSFVGVVNIVKQCAKSGIILRIEPKSVDGVAAHGIALSVGGRTPTVDRKPGEPQASPAEGAA